MKAFFQETLPEEDAVPGAVIATQSFGDFLGFNSHLHVLSTDGCFYGQGMFRRALHPSEIIRYVDYSDVDQVQLKTLWEKAGLLRDMPVYGCTRTTGKEAVMHFHS